MSSRPVWELKQDMENSKHLRTSEKQHLLHSSYTTAQTTLETELRTLIARDEEELKTTQNSTLTRLTSLITRKAELESQIYRVVAEMRVLWDRAVMEFGVVLQGRMEDLRGEMGRVGGVRVDGDGDSVGTGEEDEGGDGREGREERDGDVVI